uniref:class I SAM-dependent methyltransferase n=1 Tax=Brachyspira catarrhinii TaxID=2528966 RepID=UPI003F4B0F2A
MYYTDINSKTIDKWIDEGWEWGKPITHETFLEAKNGKWNMLLTPTKYVPKEWYPDLRDKKVLGLASGGGQQMPIFAALGSICTLMDYSQKQIDSDLMVSKRENYNINLVKADMSKIFQFDDESFDIIFHPVSNCYIEDVMHVWRESFRVLKKGGIIMSGLDNGINFIFDETSENKKEIKYKLPFNPLKDNKLLENAVKNNDGVQFSHTIEEQVRGQLKAGFKLIDIYEDTNGYGILHEYNIPTFWATLSMK